MGRLWPNHHPHPLSPLHPHTAQTLWGLPRAPSLTQELITALQVRCFKERRLKSERKVFLLQLTHSGHIPAGLPPQRHCHRGRSARQKAQSLPFFCPVCVTLVNELLEVWCIAQNVTLKLLTFAPIHCIITYSKENGKWRTSSCLRGVIF